MNADKLNQIIERKNERLEERAVNEAQRIIEKIADLQIAKQDADTKIIELRAELKKLEVQSVDAKSILGE